MLNLTNVKIMFYRRKLRHNKKFLNQFTFKEKRETTKNGFVAKKITGLFIIVKELN